MEGFKMGNNSKRDALKRYFALEDAVEKEIKSKSDLHQSDYKTCPSCYAEDGWDKKLGEILKKLNFSLEKYVEDFNSYARPGAVTIDKEGLKCNDGRCLPLKYFLRVAALQIGYTHGAFIVKIINDCKK